MPYAPVLIDQGSDDWYKDNYLFPNEFLNACAQMLHFQYNYVNKWVMNMDIFLL